MKHSIKTIIVDDEPLALSYLKAKLAKVAEINIVAECKSGREAIAAIMEHAPDLVFLDIQMPGIDGFGVIEKLQADILPLVVFTTAFEQYALDAFEVHAVDYILKPIDQQRIDRAVERAKTRMLAESNNDGKSRILGAMDSMNEHQPNQRQANIEHKIVIKDRDDITLVKQADIEWIDAAGDYVCVHANGETHIKRSTLKQLLTELDEHIFKRVHRSTIVNLNFIQKVIPHTKGEFFLQMGEYDQVKVSRNYRDVIKAFLNKK